MWTVTVYETMYGCEASSTVFVGDKASAKAIARHFNSLRNLPDSIYYEAHEEA